MFLTKENILDMSEALVDDNGNRITYGDLRNDCYELHNYIMNRQLFVILADRKIETVRLYYACMSANHVVLMLNPDSTTQFLLNYIHVYHPKYIWVPIDWIEMAKDDWIVVYKTDEHILLKTNYENIILNEELALLLTTSGSTGNPKLVRLSHRNLLDNTLAFVDAVNLKSNDRGLATLPIYYTYGLGVLHVHFAVGGTLLLSEKKLFDPLLEKFMNNEYVTNWHGVPYVYETFRKIGLFERIPRSLRLLTMGGNRAETQLHEHMNETFTKNGVRVYALYGQTEGTNILTKVPEDALVNPPGCIGVACKGMKASIDSDSGELCFSGSSVCLGYAMDCCDLAKGDDNNGFLRTGDLATIKQDGQIVITGRLKRIIKLRGIRINLEDIERDIESQFNISVVCIDNNNTMYIFTESECDSDYLIDWISIRYKLSKRLLCVKKVACIPHNSSGKIDYTSFDFS